MSQVNWHALARAIVARRVELGYTSRGALAHAAGIALRTLGDIEAVRVDGRAGYNKATIAKLEQALRWPTGAVDAILAGAGPPISEVGPVLVGDRPMPATAVKVAWLLGDDSPLPERDRRTLDAVVSKAVEAFWPPPP